MITNANTFTGGTTINAGAIVIANSTGSALGTGPVVCHKLDAADTRERRRTGESSGTITGSVTLNAGAVIFPALPNDAMSTATPSILTVGSTTFTGGAAMGILFNDVSGTAGTNWSLLNVNVIPFALKLLAHVPIHHRLDLHSTRRASSGPCSISTRLPLYSWEIVSATGGITGIQSQRVLHHNDAGIGRLRDQTGLCEFPRHREFLRLGERQ